MLFHVSYNNILGFQFNLVQFNLDSIHKQQGWYRPLRKSPVKITLARNVKL